MDHAANGVQLRNLNVQMRHRAHLYKLDVAALQAAYDAASAGDELVLKDGTYTGSPSNRNAVLEISKDVTIRAQNARMAVLDGEDARRVV